MSFQVTLMNLANEVWMSSELLLSNKLSWLLILGPIALVGDYTGFLGEALCFALSGIALIPCAERLSFVTEQVAEHTNGTIGALLNATFGNAPELLIATAALRSGFYRVVQLAMLGSMLTNLLLVFGMSCVVGGIRWQVQEIRITSGNVSVGMLLLSVTGSLLPAALILSGQLKNDQAEEGDPPPQTQQEEESAHVPTLEELQFSRVNAIIMIFMYGCYLIFQLGTHKEEFDDDDNVVESADGHALHLTPHFTSRHGRQHKASRNTFCLNWIQRLTTRRQSYSLAPGFLLGRGIGGGDGGAVELSGVRPHDSAINLFTYQDEAEEEDFVNGNVVDGDNIMIPPATAAAAAAAAGRDMMDGDNDDSDEDSGKLLPQNRTSRASSEENGYFDEYDEMPVSSGRTRTPEKGKKESTPRKEPGRLVPLGLTDPAEEPLEEILHHGPIMSFRVGIVWLFIITLCISAMSDILVDTIDGFASRARLSEVFTTMVIVPFFSNVAEQVSAILFAYRNEMDLCVGVTVGSAIQVMTFVLPGCVLIGLFVDRSMSLYFHAYETVCLFLAVIVVAAVLQGGTTNWMVGATLIGIYVMIATGFWFHTMENLSVDAESMGD